jgi:hypothetical protein
MVALSLELLKSIEKFVGRDLRDRPVPDCRIQKIPEPPRLLEGRWFLALSLHLLDELVGDDPEGRASREFRFNLGLQANGQGIYALRQLLTRFVPLQPRFLEGKVRIAP